MIQKPNKGLLVGGIIGLVIMLIILSVLIGIDSQDDGMLLGGVFLLILVDVTNIIIYFVRNAKYKKESVEQKDILQNTKALSTAATITFSRGANDGLQNSLSLRVFNNDSMVGNLSPNESVCISTNTSINRLTIGYLNAINGELIPLKKHKLTLDLSDGEKVNVVYENKRMMKIG
jgi:hypothetical protein